MTTPTREDTCNQCAAPDAPPSNETVQAWIEEATRWPDMQTSHQIIILGRELLLARRDLADIAKGLQDVGTSLDELKELL